MILFLLHHLFQNNSPLRSIERKVNTTYHLLPQKNQMLTILWLMQWITLSKSATISFLMMNCTCLASGTHVIVIILDFRYQIKKALNRELSIEINSKTASGPGLPWATSRPSPHHVYHSCCPWWKSTRTVRDRLELLLKSNNWHRKGFPSLDPHRENGCYLFLSPSSNQALTHSYAN